MHGQISTEEEAKRMSFENHFHTFLVFNEPRSQHQSLVGVAMTPNQMHGAGYYASRPPAVAFYQGQELPPRDKWGHYGA